MEAVWKARLDRLAAAHLERRMRVFRGPAGPAVPTEEGTKLVFCSNDYLALASDPRLSRALADGAFRWGVGAAASRLVSGNSEAHERLEKALAEFTGAEEAVVFPTGYQANVGAITALTEAGDLLFSDALCHASLIDGCRLSRAGKRIFRHRDVHHLKELLREETGPGLKIVITDAVFSMDGDIAPLEAIVEAAEEADALVYVDEAHSVGVMGPEGRGLAAELGLGERVAVRVVTFGKSLGVSGACVAGSRAVAGLLRSRARSLLFTTAQPAALMEAALAGLEALRCADERRAALRRNVDRFRDRARRAGLPLIDSKTPIQPVLIGSNARALEVSEALWKAGFFVQAIRPPTVAEGTARLRVALTSAHAPDQIDRLVEAIARALGEH